MLTWSNPADITYGTELGVAQLDASASVPGTFVYTPGSGTILHAGTDQTLSVIFTPTDSVDYSTATTTASINVNKTTPAINWPNPADITFGTPLGSTQFDATSPVPGVFSYNPSAGTILGVGQDQNLTVTLVPTDSTDYYTSTASASINVDKATPVITWATPAEITYGTPLSSTQLDATASVPGTFTYSPPLGTVMNAGLAQSLSVSFTPTDSVDYNNASGSTSINVAQATPTVTWSNPANIVYGTALSATQLDASASVPGVFDYSPSAGTVLHGGQNQALSVEFVPTDSVDYSEVNDSVFINVTKATPTVTWMNPSGITYGTPLGNIQLDATASVPGSFAYTPTAGTILGAGANQSLSVLFTPTDSVDYNTASGSALINVAQATPVITWPTPAGITYGTALSSTQLDATASTPGTFTYTPSAGAVLGAGTGQTLFVNFTPTDSVDYTTATGSTTINVAKANPVITWPSPAGITLRDPAQCHAAQCNDNDPGCVRLRSRHRHNPRRQPFQEPFNRVHPHGQHRLQLGDG